MSVRTAAGGGAGFVVRLSIGVVWTATWVACDPGAGASGGTDRVPDLIAEEVLRIGSVDDPETSLTALAGLDIAPDGRIYTLHRQGNEVRIHAPDGAPLGHFGGEGDGPGEFRSAVALGFEDGEVWVLDADRSRVSWFGPDGTFLRDRTVRLPVSEGSMPLPPRLETLLSDGTLLARLSIPARLIVSGEISESPVLRISAEGAVLDTAMIRHYGPETNFSLTNGPRSLYVVQPYSDAPLSAFSSRSMESVEVDRRVRPGDASFRVTKRSIGGDTLWSRSYAFDPVPLDASIVDSVVTVFAEQISSFDFMSKIDAEDALQELVFAPAHYPAVRVALLGDDGSVWLALHERGGETTRWRVLDADGQAVGEVRLPRRFALFHATRYEAWGQDLDALDVPYIVKYVVRPATSLETAGS